MAAAALVMAAPPALAQQLRVDSFVPAGNDEAAALRSITIDDFSGEDGPRLALLVADTLRDVQIDGRPWLSVLSGRFGRNAESVLGGTVRTRFTEQDTTGRRSVCVAYDDYNNCRQREDQQVPCLRVTVSLRPDLRLTRRDGQLVWRWSQEASRNAEYCPDHDDRPDFDEQIDAMLGEFASQIRHELAPAQESRQVRVMGGRDDLPRPLRDTYRNAMRQVERNPAAACAIFADLLPQAPGHVQLVHNNALCAEWRGDYPAAEQTYQQLANGRGAAREGREGLARIAQYRRAQA